MEKEKSSFHLQHSEKGYVLIHLLVALFGISAWIGINGIFVQLPVLVNSAPEGWKLPSYIVVVVQAANIGPVIYVLIQHFYQKLIEPGCILSVLISGTVAMCLLSFFYYKTTFVSGTEYSVALLVLTFFPALVGCFSSILFMPYLRHFKEVYIISYFIGEGISGVLPSIVALIQGIQDYSECIIAPDNTLKPAPIKQRFPPRDYFLFIFVMLLSSLIAFVILQYSSFVQKNKNQPKEETNTNDNIQIGHCEAQSKFAAKNLSIKEHRMQEGSNSNETLNTEHIHKLSPLTTNYLCFLLALLCFFGNGFFLSIQSYSCLPYGNLAYQLSVTFSLFANPFACFLGLWIMPRSIKMINYLFILCIFLGSYVTCLAIMSSSPPLQESELGLVLVVISWTLLIGFISYVKLVIVSIFRQTTSSKSLLYIGSTMQAGSATGAITAFVLIAVTNIFKTYDSCSVSNY